MTVNCAAIAAALADSELFGHQAGAFTGADRDHAGYFEQADEGTLFLDEVGELSLDCQAKLLRVLEGKPFRRVGGKQDVYADVRILAATNRDLDKMVRDGKFRQDLFFRLGLNIPVPPLRDRPEDLPALVQHFLPRLSQEYHRRLELTPAALRRLREYSWPGNVRQLRAVLEMAAAMSDGEVLDAADFRLPGESGAGEGDVPGSVNMEQVEEWNIRRALKRADNNFARAAELLGIHRDTLRSKMRKFNITCDES